MNVSRRSMLRGMLAGVPITLRLPVLDAMLDGNGQALASGRKLPTRFGVFYWGGGVVSSDWVPAATGTAWALPPSLADFADLQAWVTLVTGTNHRNSSPGHIPARGIALSSSHDLSNAVKGVGTFRGQTMPEPSIDQLVAEHWKGQTLFDSLEIGICRKGPYRSNTSWKRGGSTYTRHEPSPQKLFDRLFRGETADADDPNAIAAATALDRSVLDVVMADARRLGRQVAAPDRQRLDQHLEGLRSIERRLQERQRIVRSGQCRAPDRPMAHDYGDGTGREEKSEKSKAMSDLLAIALACGMTRVFSYEWSAGQSHAVYWEVGVSEEHHPLTHTEANGGPYLPRTVKFIMSHYAYLARKLAEMREGAGTVLDNTLILGTSEHANAGKHNYTDHPFLLVGKAGGAIRGGLHHRDPDPKGNFNAPRVLLTAARAVGVPVAKLGQEPTHGEGSRVAAETLGEIEA
jgi:hypothetical protein